MSDGKLFRLLASRLDKDGECLLLLPLGFRDALLDGSYRMKWDATWLEDDYVTRATLTDTQRDLIELGISRLVDCVDIKIENNITTNCGGCGGGSSAGGDIVNVDCGGGGGSVDVPADSPIGGDGSDVFPDDLGGGHMDPESPIPESLTEGGFEDWGSYDSYICDFSHYVPEAISRMLLGLETATDKLTTIAGVLSVIAYLFPSAWAAKAGAASLWELVTAITELVIGETAFDSLSDLADDVMSEPFYSELVCIIYSNRYHLPTAHSKLLLALSAKISSYAWSGELETKIQNYVNKSVPTRWLYSEMISQVLGRFETGRDCSSCAEASGGLILIDFDNFGPNPDWNLLGACYPLEVDGNWVYVGVAHTSGNDGGAGWYSTSVLSWPDVDTMNIYRIEVDVRTSTSFNDDTISFHYGYGDEAVTIPYSGEIFSESWTTLGWDTNLHFDIADGIEQGFGFRCESFEARNGFYIDNIKIYYA